ncbi:MAG: winged helix-turn-helix transcriptional regulator [Bacteroidaceae bacterium]|nr:winged helix-turn-helix transcriptional regulator [Bacteroidaceae bacterium]
MTQYRKITKNMAGKLKPKEAYLFYCLALKSDFITYESNIEQESLAKEYGIEDTDQISDWLYKFQSYGLLRIIKLNIKGQYGKFQKCRYLLNTDNYVFISDLLKDEPISRQLKGFLILLKCKCLSGTNTTLYSQNQLAKELGIGKSTISNYMKEAEEKGYITKDEKGIHLIREDIFYLVNMPKPDSRKKKNKSEKSKEILTIILD